MRAPSWRDPRLLIGLVLVAASVVLGARVVAANSDTELYLTAVHTLTPGTTVQEADLRSVHVNLGDAAERYLPATQVPPAGSIVVQTVREGELLPTQALGSAEDVRLRPLNLPVTGGSAEGMRPGDVVPADQGGRRPVRRRQFQHHHRAGSAGIRARPVGGGGQRRADRAGAGGGAAVMSEQADQSPTDQQPRLSISMLTAVRDQEETRLVATITEADSGLSVAARCAGLSELLAAAQAGRGMAALVGADLDGLDSEVVA
ncbi:MAG: hypothetical protein CSB46_10745, partial [Micrococcales bacterium]